MKFEWKIVILITFIVLLLGIGGVSANENIGNITLDESGSLDYDELQLYQNESDIDVIESAESEVLGSADDDTIVVNNWEELQYYCAQTDKNYNLKLKENTNFYPASVEDSNCQIKIKNNVKIIGSENSYIGDSPNYLENKDTLRYKYIPIVVEENSRVGITLENITFKWIYMNAGFSIDSSIFIQISGRRNSIIKNCIFQDIYTRHGHSCILHLQHGTATLDNCSFINCSNSYGCLSVFTRSGETPHMTVQNCYFEGNYASTEPGCINNCAKLTVYNTTFVKNRSFWWAGAIHTHSGASSTIYDSNFIDNVAGWNGGALYTYGNLNVYNSIFRGNNCTTDNGGGAIGACEYGSQPHIYIEGCLFEDNTNNCWVPDSLSDGPGRGGAISIMDKGSLEVRDTTFIENSAAIGTAICALAIQGYGTPDVIIVNNSFINHTRSYDVLNIRIWNESFLNISDNYYFGNSIVFSNLTLTKLSEGKEQAFFEITSALSHPDWYDADILNRTLYDVFVNGEYVKTVDSTVFSIDFGDLDICSVYVVPTISNRKSNEVTATSTREYIFVSKTNGNDNNNGVSRDAPVSSIKRALELAQNCQNIILLDGEYSEDNIAVAYDVTVKGEGNATLTGATSFISSADLTLKNLKINNLNTEIFIKNNNNVSILNCILTNNIALLVENNGAATISNSILLNNSDIIRGNEADLDYNWWGNSLPALNINSYVTLNVTSDVSALENNQKANVRAVFYLNDGSKYSRLPDINLGITALNGTVSQNIAVVDLGVVYTLTAFGDGVFTVSYNNVSVSRTFEFLKSDPTISLAADDIMVGDNLSVEVSVPSDGEGNLTVRVGNLSQTKEIQSSKSTFTFENLKAGSYTVIVTYSGDKKYLKKNLTSSAVVNKFESTTQLNLSTVDVGEDVIITITTVDTSTGNVTLSINDDVRTLTLTGSKAEYTIRNIERGDYLITAVYNGDDRYLPSNDSRFIEVDNLNATMSIKADDITYGDLAIIKVSLNDDATGSVIVTIDGVTNRSELRNGQAEIAFSNLEAGVNKNISVFYSGDDTYFNLTDSSTFTISKADLDFIISSEDIKIGQFAEILIKVPQRTSGTFTINQDVVTIPLSGEILYVIPDLEIGNYTYSAVYSGNNYKTVSKTISFKVIEYPIPQVPNEGLDAENTHKSPYETSANGNVAFIIPFEEKLTGDLLIDSWGNVYLTTCGGVYAFNQTMQLWQFTSQLAEGNFSGIAIGRDVIAAPKSGDTLYFINQTAGEIFGGSNIYQGSSLFAPVVSSDATLYVVSEYQVTSEDYKLTVIPYRLWENGGDPTLISIGDTKPLCSPTLNGDIIVVVSENRLRMIDAETLEFISIKQANYQPVRPVIGEGNIVYAVLSDSIVAYSANGVQVWKTKVVGGVGCALALDNEQGLYHVNSKKLLYRFDLVDGSQSKFSDLKVTSGILIDTNSNVYFGSGNVFYALDSEGKVLWKSELDSDIVGNPVMDASGFIYVPTEKGIVALTYDFLKDAGLKVTVDDIVEGDDSVITVSWNNQTTGSISLFVNGDEITVSAEDAKVVKIVSGLDVGYYDVNVVYSGDMQFKPCSISKTFVVRSSEDVANNIAFDGNSTFSFSLDNATGNLTVFVAGKYYSKVLADGRASISVDDLAPGEWKALVVYSGDRQYGNANRTFYMSVPKFNVDLNELISTENIVSRISVALPGDAEGNLTLSVGTRKYSEKISAGNAVIVVDDLPAGNYTATLTYSGDDRYEGTSKSLSICLTKIPVILDDENVIVESGLEVKISVRLDSGATGTFTFSVDGGEYRCDVRNTLIISDLEPGNYTGTLTYKGNDRYDATSKVIHFEVVNATGTDNTTDDNATDHNGTAYDNSTDANVTVKDNVTIVVSADDITVGSDAVVQVKSSQDSIMLTITVGKEKYYQKGSGSLTISDLTFGKYDVIVSFSGDDKFNEASNSTTFNVFKVTVPEGDGAMSIPESGSDYSISLPEDATGTFTVTVDGKSYSQELVNGKATVTVSELGEGTHNVTVTYSGDGKYESMVKSTEIVVNPTNSTDNNDTDPIDNSTNAPVNVSEEALVIPENGSEYSISLPDDATGTLTVTVDGVEYSQELVNGKATVSIPELGEGTHNVTVSYSGDGRYSAVSKSSVVVKDPVNSTDVNDTVQPVPDDAFNIPESGSDYSISLPEDATGTLTVTVDGKNYTETLVNGKATVSIPELGEGAHNITVTYSGDGKYSQVSKSYAVVKEHVPVIRLTGSNLSMLYTAGKYFKIRLTADGQPLANQKVKITLASKTYTKITDRNGYASLKIGLAPKTYAVKVTYGNLTVAKKVTVKSIITAKNVNAKRSAKTVKIKVTLKKVNGKYLKNKKVTLKFNKKTFKVKTNKKGVAVFTIKNSVYKKLKLNKKYAYQVIYVKDKVKKTIKFKK